MLIIIDIYSISIFYVSRPNHLSRRLSVVLLSVAPRRPGSHRSPPPP